MDIRDAEAGEERLALGMRQGIDVGVVLFDDFLAVPFVGFGHKALYFSSMPPVKLFNNLHRLGQFFFQGGDFGFKGVNFAHV